MAESDGRSNVIKLLVQAQTEARKLREPILDYLIERAIDEAQAGAYLPQEPQTPYEPSPPNVTALILRAAKRGGQPDQT